MTQPSMEEMFSPTDAERYNGGPGEESGPPLDEFEMAITEAFPDNDWTPDRLLAMKEAIRICAETDYAEKSKPPGREGLALILEAAPKGKKK